MNYHFHFIPAISPCGRMAASPEVPDCHCLLT